MVKFTSSLLVAALIAAPAFASANWDDLNTRDLSEQHIYGRELTETEAVFAREMDDLFTRFSEDLASREMEFSDLAERSKIGERFKHFFTHTLGGLAKKAIGLILRREEPEDGVFARDVNDFESRELDELFQRYISEIEERTPTMFDFMKTGMKTVQNLAQPPAASDIGAREFGELSERDFVDQEDLLERDLDLDLDLAERDYEEEVYEREYNDEDLLEREYDEFEEREIDELD